MIHDEYAIAQRETRALSTPQAQNHDLFSLAQQDFSQERYWTSLLRCLIALSIERDKDIRSAVKMLQKSIYNNHLNQMGKWLADCLMFNATNRAAQDKIRQQLRVVLVPHFTQLFFDDLTQHVFRMKDLDALKKFLLREIVFLKNQPALGIERQRVLWMALTPGTVLHEIFAIQNGPNEPSLRSGTLAEVVKALVDEHVEAARLLSPASLRWLTRLDSKRFTQLVYELSLHALPLYELIKTYVERHCLPRPPANAAHGAMRSGTPYYPNQLSFTCQGGVLSSAYDAVSNDHL